MFGMFGWTRAPQKGRRLKLEKNQKATRHFFIVNVLVKFMTHFKKFCASK